MTVKVTYGTVTRTRITIAADEVRVKFPDDADREYSVQAVRAAEALQGLYNGVTLRGRLFSTDDGGFSTSLATAKGRTVGRFRVTPDFRVQEIA